MTRRRKKKKKKGEGGVEMKRAEKERSVEEGMENKARRNE